MLMSPNDMSEAVINNPTLLLSLKPIKLHLSKEVLKKQLHFKLIKA